MATQNKRKLAALNNENCEEHLRSNFAQNANVPRSQEDYISQVFEEIEGRVIKKLSKVFTAKEFPPEKKAMERFCICPVTSQSLFGDFNGFYQQTKIFIYELMQFM